jgi:hypothetical protein
MGGSGLLLCKLTPEPHFAALDLSLLIGSCGFILRA